MKKVIVSMHLSLDGFVAGPNGEIEWILVDEEMFDFGTKLTNNADTALYGRVTYEIMNGYWPSAADQPNASKHDVEHSSWYNKVTKVVVSKSMKGKLIKDTVIISDNLTDEINDLKQKPGKNTLIYGSPTAVHSLTQHHLIDEYWLYINPVILGRGIPLFSDRTPKSDLKLLASKEFSCGVIALHYELGKKKKAKIN